MSRISGCLAKLAEQNKKALVPYIVAGDPNVEITVPLMHKLVEQGADILEIGVPFSDPMAEGPVIQLAHERALANKVGLRQILDMIKTFRATDQTTPVVLMGYANPIEYMGYETFSKRAKEVGVDGLLTVDIPPEEADTLNGHLKANDIDNIFLIAPTTSVDRVKKIVEIASGYIYYVSLKGVTGAGNLDVNAVREKLAEIKSFSDLPICVGFGIKDAESASAVAKVAEGVVVGSALVDHVFKQSSTIASQQDLLATTTAVIGEIRQAIDN